MVEHLPTLHKALNWIPVLQNTKLKKQNKTTPPTKKKKKPKQKTKETNNI
jgi:hypothetical protein